MAAPGPNSADVKRMVDTVQAMDQTFDSVERAVTLTSNVERERDVVVLRRVISQMPAVHTEVNTMITSHCTKCCTPETAVVDAIEGTAIPEAGIKNL